MKEAQVRPLRVRRSPHVLIYWRDGQLIIRNYATGIATTANPLVCALLDLCGDWQTTITLSSAFPPEAAVRIPALIGRLSAPSHRSTILGSTRANMTAFDRWNHSRIFHRHEGRSLLVAAGIGPPRARRVDPGQSETHQGSTNRPAGPVEGNLQPSRRRAHWRRFSKIPITLEDLSTVLE